MKKHLAIATVFLAVSSLLSAQKKETERLADSAAVLQVVLARDLTVTILNKANCILVFPNVRKVAIGIGGSYGRGGLFAGVSLSGASLDTDDDANKALYGKEISTGAIVGGGSPNVPAAQPLVDILDRTSPSRK